MHIPYHAMDIAGNFFLDFVSFFCETLAALAKSWVLCMFNGGHLAHWESDIDSPDALLNLTQKEHMYVVNMIL